MADHNENLPLGAAEILIEMRAMRRENQENNDRLLMTINRLTGTLTEHVVDIRQNVQRIDQRLEKIEKKLDEFTDF
ncbi:hypothetical protein H8B15_13605 [Hymenobacter sp. BT507]|uniref:Uncharacterized protein n=1 Tax=Hymenobacter citatus TaxID=2763506 RepID=A0ABR7MLJ9_9BACT|nr:hypothetical protein [Hymenobacter citatus]MBC6611963.1 hypothetical protein [Hymenobacter citatus]